MDSPIALIKEYLHIFYCRRYFFLITFTTLSLLIAFGSFFSPKKYEAKSTVFIEENVLKNLMKGLTVTPSMGDRIRVLRYQMLSRDLVLRVLKKLDMDVKLKTPEALESMVKYCQEVTNITLKGNDLFFVSVIDQDPQFAKDYINTLVNTYVEENLSAKREESFGADRFLSEQLEYYKKALDAVEDKIYNFRKKTGIFSTLTEASLIDEIKAYEEELKKLKITKNELLATLNTIRQQLDAMKNSKMPFSQDLFMDTEVSETGSRIETLRSRLQELLLIYNDQYPAVVRLKNMITDLEKQQKAEQNQEQIQKEGSVAEEFSPTDDPIFVDLQMRRNTTQSDLNALQAREQELLSQINKDKQTLENFPKDKKTLADMERDRVRNQSVYDDLRQRAGIAEVSKQMEVADKATTFRIVDPAILPNIPVGMTRLSKMLLGLFLGFVAGLAVVIIREKLDDTIKSDEALRSLGVSVLAEIPLMSDMQQTQLERKKDKLFYSYSGVCLLLVAVMIGHDLLGLTMIDQLIADMRLSDLVSSMVNLMR